MKQKALLLTDLLGLPRGRQEDRLDWHETFVWRAKLARNDPDLVHIGIPAAPIKRSRRMERYYKAGNLSVNVPQIGAVTVRQEPLK